jgi:ATP-dependent Clp protease ATP-binding subunit ClpX
MDTTHILFICGGTFTGLGDIIKRRLGSSAIGFTGELAKDEDPQQLGHMLAQVTPDDLIEFGMIPEFVGRLPVITALEPLGLQILIQILTEPKNALVKQYRRFFDMEGCELEFTPAALEIIAKKALERDTGARALRGVIEDLMLEVMYRLPEEGNNGRYVVTGEVAEGKVDLFSQRQLRKESA